MAKPEKVESITQEVIESSQAGTPPKQKFTRGKAIVLPVFSFKNRDCAYIKFTGEMYKGEPLLELNKETGKMELKPPAVLAPIIDLETGEEFSLIMNTVLIEIMKKNEYVNHAFEIVASKRDGKRYKDFSVYPITVDRVYAIE